MEDRATSARRITPRAVARRQRIVVLAYPRIANFDDFDPLRLEPKVDLVFVRPTLVFAFCNLRPGLARRFGGGRMLLAIWRRLVGAGCGDDSRDNDEGGTTNLHC